MDDEHQTRKQIEAVIGEITSKRDISPSFLFRSIPTTLIQSKNIKRGKHVEIINSYLTQRHRGRREMICYFAFR